MRSISVWYFIRMKTGGIFYFVCWCFRHRITSPLFFCATQVKPGVSLKNALKALHISFHFADIPRCQHFVEDLRDTHFSLAS